MGRVVPDLSCGDTSLGAFRHRRALLIFAGDAACTACREWLTRGAESHETLAESESVAIAALANCATWRAPVPWRTVTGPLFLTAGEHAAVIAADRFGEVVGAWGVDHSSLPAPADAAGALLLAARACPE